MKDNKTVADPVAEIAQRALAKTSIVTVAGWDPGGERYLFVAPYDCRIEAVRLVSDTAVEAHNSNYFSFQVRNLTAGETLLSSAQTTRIADGAPIVADEPYLLPPDQNQVVSGGDVLELEVTETGVATEMGNARLIAAVEYQ